MVIYLFACLFTYLPRFVFFLWGVDLDAWFSWTGGFGLGFGRVWVGLALIRVCLVWKGF